LSVRALFETPTVAALARSIERLARGKQAAAAPPIIRAAREGSGALPLSFAQQRLWFLQQMEPNNPLYNMPWSTRLAGTLNVAALETALNGIVSRHEILRTVYRVEQDVPVQIVLPETHIALEMCDLSSLPATEREPEARRIAQEQSARPFDLASDLMFRPMLLKLDERDHVLFVNTHHIASDGWSMGIMQSDLAAFYEAALTDEAPQLPQLPIQYSDFAVWQRNWLRDEVLEHQLAYWRNRLSGAPPILNLSFVERTPGVQGARAGMERFPIPKKLAEQIALVSRQHAVTPFMTMLAAFQTLILHLAKQPDIVLGTDVAGRSSVETEALIGFFVNLIVLRTDLSGDPSFSDLLGRVREVTLNAYAHQELPFDKLVEELRPERVMSRNPLVQVLFVHENTPRSRRSLPGIESSGFPIDLPSKFDLAVFCRNSAAGIGGIWVYNPDLFDASVIARMAGQYQAVLEDITVNPHHRLSETLQFIAATEQQERITEHNEFLEASLQKLKNVRRQPVKVSQSRESLHSANNGNSK
jgi:Condensation domain